jgi:hypothetical protein
MTEPNFRPCNGAEALVRDVFEQLERDADPQIARLHLANRLRRGTEPRPRHVVRPVLRLTAFLAGLMLLGSWAGNLEFSGLGDGQQVTLHAPRDFNPCNYPHWVAVFASHSDELAQQGGHSLIVDYSRAEDGSYMFQLSLLGVDYSVANEWIRDVIGDTPELTGATYAVTQPLVSYGVSVKEMLAYKLGLGSAVERRVVEAWEVSGNAPSGNGMLYLIAQPKDYAQRVSMFRE